MALVLKQIFVTGSDEIAQNYTIESWHVSQSVDALTGQEAYDITISGSLNLTGSTLTGSTANITSITGSLLGTASLATTATTASYVLNAVSSSFASTASYVQTAQTASYVLNAVSASFASTASYVLNAVSASFASTSSYAQTSQTASYVLGTAYPSGSASIPNSVFKFIAGAGKTVGGILGVNIAELSGRTLGQNCFVSLALSGSAGFGPVVQVGSLSTGVLTFTSAGGDADFYYTIFYI